MLTLDIYLVSELLYFLTAEFLILLLSLAFLQTVCLVCWVESVYSPECLHGKTLFLFLLPSPLLSFLGVSEQSRVTVLCALNLLF